jgi:hypothetical protein
MVADSSTLILLAKCGLLEIVCNLFEIIVPKAVNIVVASEDLVKNYPDAALISDLTSKGAIKVQSLGSNRLPLPISLHRGGRRRLAVGNKAGEVAVCHR